ncbi:hypothetical protein FA15DRAFT_550701, partial [Coprinopsis marcescibilis]
MGHRGYDDLRKMIKEGMVKGIQFTDLKTPRICRVCVMTRPVRKPFPGSDSPKPVSYGEKICSDIWGPATVQSIGGNRYFAIFQDHFS